MTSRQRSVDERGMTLIELMIAVALLGIVIVPVVTGMVFGLAHSGGTRDRIADSASAQLVSAYLPGDVQSAQGVFTEGATCGIDAATDTVRLRLEWTDPDPAVATTTSVVYFTRSVDGLLELHRAACTAGGDGAAENTTTLLVHHLDEAEDPVLVEFECAGDGDAVDAVCDAAGTPGTVRVITMRLRAFNQASEAASYSPFEFELRGTRRTDLP